MCGDTSTHVSRPREPQRRSDPRPKYDRVLPSELGHRAVESPGSIIWETRSQEESPTIKAIMASINANFCGVSVFDIHDEFLCFYESKKLYCVRFFSEAIGLCILYPQFSWISKKSDYSGFLELTIHYGRRGWKISHTVEGGLASLGNLAYL